MRTKKQRVLAWIGIGLLLLLYVISFVLGVFGSKNAFPMFLGALLCTFFIPTMIYVFQLILKNARDKKMTEEDFEKMFHDEQK